MLLPPPCILVLTNPKQATVYKMGNVLIISHSFPPLNNIAARRFGLMVKYMEQFGWCPWVLTVEANGSFPTFIPEYQCIRIGRHPQEDERVDKHNHYIDELPLYLKLLRAGAGKIGFRFRAIDSTVFSWYKIVRNNYKQITNKLPNIDLVIASYGPAASLWLGKWFSKYYNVPWIADYRDLGALRADGRNMIAILADKLIERYLLSTSLALTSVSKTLAHILADKYHKPSKVIYNGWDDSGFNVENIQIQSMTGIDPYIYYAGRLYPHRMSSMYKLLKSMEQIPNIYFKFRSLGPYNLEKVLLIQARLFGIEDRISILSPTDPKQVDIEARNALVNLAVEDMNQNTEWSKGTLTGKFLQLLPINPPILSIARPDSEMGPILNQTNKGRLCSEVNEITDFLRKIMKKKKMSGNNFEIEKYSKLSQTKKLCNLLELI